MYFIFLLKPYIKFINIFYAGNRLQITAFSPAQCLLSWGFFSVGNGNRVSVLIRSRGRREESDREFQITSSDCSSGVDLSQSFSYNPIKYSPGITFHLLAQVGLSGLLSFPYHQSMCFLSRAEDSMLNFTLNWADPPPHLLIELLSNYALFTKLSIYAI